ncbi:leucine-rich repeat-containing protein 72 isoform X3 [Hyla sarda]|uniref:leucine-rich repeat-containing protein 72 isoform X3 n=1 Tax=Hyla sarda TaxID=327740 RepID=UPI0024C43F73|nr:leucine-rich repeat-containing protein 72 isoform X3 [Hyla sarda]XP_056374861.1 leucine-rich repeat-containing protein 72 isoform X3 [Hyla sarda]
MAAMIIEEQTQKRGYKTDGDVSELYLGRRGLKEVPDLSRFRLLKYLWLNHNKISKVNFLGNNFRMAELYLNGNKLCDITGSLKHLTSLHTLMLNDNRLTDLQATVKELKGMTNLRVLNLFQNPLEQDPGYRHCVIHHLPSVQLLDREHVTQKEKEEAFQLYNPHRTAVIQSLGFGRRTDSVLGSRPAAQSSTAHRSSKRHHDTTSNSDGTDAMTLEDKVLLRGYQRSIMQFTMFDWNKIPVSRLKRSEEKSMETPQLLTVEFR